MKLKTKLVLLTACITALSFDTYAQTFTKNGAVTLKTDGNGNIFTKGKILIGTFDSSKAGTYVLAVNGDAIFNKVKVKIVIFLKAIKTEKL